MRHALQCSVWCGGCTHKIRLTYHIHLKVIALVRTSHVTHLNESRIAEVVWWVYEGNPHAYLHVMSLIRTSQVTHLDVSRTAGGCTKYATNKTHCNTPCNTNFSTHYSTHSHVDESCHTYGRATCHTQMRYELQVVCWVQKTCHKQNTSQHTLHARNMPHTFQ